MADPISDGLLLSFYGDDLTGSTDAMEALTVGGVPTVLFTGKPDEALFKRFAGVRAIGLAGTSRSETPEWMDTHLRAAFEWLKSLRSPIAHYKICSTFDSSPCIGSIGRAIEIGCAVWEQDTAALVVGAPQLKRWTAFGHLFAGFGGRNYRIDRHPVMSRHPVTPMDEADLLVHLRRQTALSSDLLDIAAMRSPERGARLDAVIAAGAGVVLLDVDSLGTQALAGEELWRVRESAGPFVVGSSGVEYALLQAWRRAELIGPEKSFEPAGPVERIAVVSGSVSPTTERQIRHASVNGFDLVALDPLALVGESADAAFDAAVADGRASLKCGRSVILYTALGPSADRGGEIDRDPTARHRLGRALGRILQRLCATEKLKRAVIAGGDTSSHALGQLGVEALTVKMPLADSPGSPLCAAHGRGSSVEGLELALKGGQVGADCYFEEIRAGRSL